MSTKINYVGSIYSTQLEVDSKDIMFYQLEVDSGSYELTLIKSISDLYINYPTDNITKSYLIAIQILKRGISLLVKRVSTIYNKTSLSLTNVGGEIIKTYPDYRKIYNPLEGDSPYSQSFLEFSNYLYSFSLSFESSEMIQYGYLIVNKLGNKQLRYLIRYPYTEYKLEKIPGNYQWLSLNILGVTYYIPTRIDNSDTYSKPCVDKKTLSTNLYIYSNGNYNKSSLVGYISLNELGKYNISIGNFLLSLDSIEGFYLYRGVDSPIQSSDYVEDKIVTALDLKSQIDQTINILREIFTDSDFNYVVIENNGVYKVTCNIISSSFSRYYKIYNNVKKFNIIPNWLVTYDYYHELSLGDSFNRINFYSKNYNNCENIEIIIKHILDKPLIQINEYTNSSKIDLLRTESFYNLKDLESSSIVDIELIGDIDISDLGEGSYYLRRLESDNVQESDWFINLDNFELEDFNLISDSGNTSQLYQDKLLEIAIKNNSLLFLSYVSSNNYSKFNTVTVNRNYYLDNIEYPGWILMMDLISSNSSCSGEVTGFDTLSEVLSNGNYFGHTIDEQSLQYQLSNTLIRYKDDLNYESDSVMTELVLTISRIVKELSSRFPFGESIQKCYKVCNSIMESNNIKYIVTPYINYIESDNHKAKILYTLNYNLFNRDFINLTVYLKTNN